MKYVVTICITVLLVAAMKYYEPIAAKRIELQILYQLTQLKKQAVTPYKL